MGWSQQFIDTLDKPSKKITYALKFLSRSKLYIMSDGQSVGTNTEIAITNADVTIDSVSVTPQRWSVNFGGFSISIKGDLRPVLQSQFKKGAVAELIMIRDGIRNRVCIGQLRSITGGRGVWNLQFVDFLTMMQGRLTQNISQAAFWYNAGKTAKVTQSFNYSSSTRLYLDDISIFEKETGQNGVIFVEDSQHNVTGYWTWDSKTVTTSPAGYLNIVDVGIYPSESSHDHLQVNDIITSVARLRGRPDYVFARLVMSTGDGTQGPFDDYPESWGLGVQWNPNLFNVQNLNAYYNTNWSISTGTHEIDLKIMESGAIGTFLDAVLSMGMWPVWRQNELSWRVCQDPNKASYFSVVDHITDRDIISIDSHELYARDQSVVYGTSKIQWYDTASQSDTTSTYFGTSIRILPAAPEIVRNHRLIYRVDYQKYQAPADLTRLRQWDAEPYENLQITVTEKHCLLSAGDIVEISSKYLYGLRESTGSTFSNRRAMVLSVRWNPSRSTVNLSLGITS